MSSNVTPQVVNHVRISIICGDIYQQLTESHVRIQFEEWMNSSVTP